MIFTCSMPMKDTTIIPMSFKLIGPTGVCDFRGLQNYSALIAINALNSMVQTSCT